MKDAVLEKSHYIAKPASNSMYFFCYDYKVIVKITDTSESKEYQFCEIFDVIDVVPPPLTRLVGVFCIITIMPITMLQYREFNTLNTQTY